VTEAAASQRTSRIPRKTEQELRSSSQSCRSIGALFDQLWVALASKVLTFSGAMVRQSLLAFRRSWMCIRLQKPSGSQSTHTRGRSKVPSDTSCGRPVGIPPAVREEEPT